MKAGGGNNSWLVRHATKIELLPVYSVATWRPCCLKKSEAFSGKQVRVAIGVSKSTL